MSEPPQKAGRGPVPLGLLGMLGLMMMVEALVARHRGQLTSLIPANWHDCARAAGHEAAACDVLCFGDSQVKLGVLPLELERRLGLRAYNLALHGGQAPASYFLLRRALRAGARPSALVIGAYPGLQGVDPRINLRQWPELLDLAECVELAASARDARLMATSLLDLALPTVQARTEVRTAVRAALLDHEPPGRAHMQTAAQAWRLNAGAQPAETNPAFADDVGDFGLGERRHRWASKRVNTLYTERFLALAAARGIPVFWLMPIVSPALQRRRDELDLDAPYARFVATMQARFPNLVVVDGRRSGFDRARFIDPVHLDHRGAAILSASLGEVIQQRLHSPGGQARWIELPAFAELVARARLDEQSRPPLVMRPVEERRPW